MADTAPIVQSWADALDAPVALTLHTTGSATSDEMTRFGEFLADTAGPKLVLTLKKSDAPLPFFETEKGLKFFTLPGAKILDLLLYALKATPDAVPAPLAAPLQRLELPATLDLFVAEFCPYCPAIARQLITLALGNPNVRLSVYDGSLFPEEADKRGVLAAPTLIYDGDMRWSGQFDVASAMEFVAGRSPEELSPDAIRALLEEGEAARVTAMVARADKPFASLSALLAHEKWSVRLGAMVVMEELAESHPAIVSKTAATLLAGRASLDPSALGDIIYIAGLSGDAAHLSTLNDILEGPCDDAVREAVEEAMDTLVIKEP
ncbi:thioredoxin family protein [Desulfoluna spongiiphila]|uniref:Thioredoxin domain-containing protein n=1 Tax=Desulfoluna spongiiphila TaxID=419481 RepID=A0A1G5JP87_9BACT|nr:thioredoxin family protein [Desulfoluna spongiiphila]SCY90215.1 Thioredoxin domain-containing protein [Desulfoluna spongiiphila]VVS93392.1 thioredoxin-like fold [Desulfoluna spongiiphila]